MRKILVFVAALCAAILSAAPVEVTKKYTLSSNNAVVKAGETLKFKLLFECADGAELGSYKAYVLRKNAPEAFFAKPEVKLKYSNAKTKKVSSYDAIYLTDDKNFQRRMKSGECDVVINTAGMPAGDYAIAVQSWLLKEKRSYYKAELFYLTISEGDDRKFAPTPQQLPAAALRNKAASWYKNFAIVPDKLAGAAGTKYQVTCDFTAADKYFFGGYCVFVMRKNVPAKFFERSGLKIKFADKAKQTPHGNDQTTLVKFKHMPSVETQKFDFELDTTGFPPGEYKLSVEIRLVDRQTQKTSYPFKVLPLTVK
ncbi:MAG: hypothetical protein E7052_08825 [Lentisphaerae bacterium]|nr:hypothetical protein [Lentisphaerota bacterium]